MPPAKSPAFRVYYADREPYTGDPWNAPAFGVLVIVEPDKESGRRVVFNGDYYGWDEDLNRWFPYDFPGLIDYLQRPGKKRVLIGRLVDSDTWNNIMRQAQNDPDFPPRTNAGRARSKVR